MNTKLKKIISFLIIALVISSLGNKVLALEFPASITNIYELRDNSSLSGYTGNKRLVASGVGDHGYYLGTEKQFLPYKVGDSTEKETGGISGYKYALFCTLFGAASPAENSYSVIMKEKTAPSSCTIVNNSWGNVAIQAGVGAIINSVTPSDNHFSGTELQDYYDAEIAINQFLYEKTNNACHISNKSCGSAAVSVSENVITDPSQKAIDLVNLAKAAYDNVAKLTNTSFSVTYPTNKVLNYSTSGEIWKSEHIKINNLSKYASGTQIVRAVLKNANGKEHKDYAYITPVDNNGTYQIGVCNSDDPTNPYCKKIEDFEPLPAGNYTVEVTIGGQTSYEIAQNYNCGSEFQTVTPAFTNTKTVSDSEKATFTFTVAEKTGSITIEKVDENGAGLPGAEVKVIGEDGSYTNTIKFGEGQSTKTLYGLKYGTYIITEDKAPNGYIKDTTSYKVIINDSNLENKVTIVNAKEKVEEAKFNFTLLKVDENNRALTGADFNIFYGSTKQVIDNLSINGILSRDVDGGTKVCIEETDAPKGYKIVQDKFCFEFDEKGKIELEDEYDYINLVKNSKGAYTIKVINVPEDKSITYIKKIDSNTNELLAGAKLQLIDKDGKVKDTWETSDKPYLISGLEIGTYYIEEIEAPEGYSLNENKQEVKITSNSQVQTIKFKNTKMVKVPNTLANMSKLLIVFGVIAAFTGGLMIYKNTRKRNS